VLENPEQDYAVRCCRIPGAETAGRTSKSKDCGGTEETGDFVHRTVWHMIDVGRGISKRKRKTVKSNTASSCA
jgi:hypothetical protein